MKSVMKRNFSRNPQVNISRSKFERTSGLKTSFDGGQLVPIFVDEALPGDTFNMRASLFTRVLSPMIYPIMDNMFLETFWFEIPVRQVWDNWEKFNGEQDNPGDSTDFLVPTMTAPTGGFDEGELLDQMGVPPGIENLEVSALFPRAYNHVYNTWFRDQNLQDQVQVSHGDGPDNPDNYVILNRGKRHDYFTSSLPWPQKSDSGSVELPLGDTAPVITDGTSIVFNHPVQGETNLVGVSSGASINSNAYQDVGTVNNYQFGSQTGLQADLSEATAATINQLRQSIAVQRLFEKDARGGTRYIEVIKNHFNVDSPDLRLQRPGYLGGGHTQINVTPVAQTVGDDTGTDQTPMARLAAYGTAGATNHGFTRSFTEHTIILGIANVRVDLTYQQGVDRMWKRQTRFDFFWPELATIGEQEVRQEEIWASDVPEDNDIIFGYQERFAEYRYKNSRIASKMRSSATGTLHAWHLATNWEGTAPTLGSPFITDTPPIDRVVAVPDEPHFILDAYFKLTCARPMPMFGIPGLDKL